MLPNLKHIQIVERRELIWINQNKSLQRIVMIVILGSLSNSNKVKLDIDNFWLLFKSVFQLSMIALLQTKCAAQDNHFLPYYQWVSYYWSQLLPQKLRQSIHDTLQHRMIERLGFLSSLFTCLIIAFIKEHTNNTRFRLYIHAGAILTTERQWCATCTAPTTTATQDISLPCG